MKKIKENKAGNYIPIKFAKEIEKKLAEHSDVSNEFARGAAFALSYLTCPKYMGMYGKDFDFYLENALVVMAIRDNAKSADSDSISQAQAVINELKDLGINVVEAYVVREGN